MKLHKVEEMSRFGWCFSVATPATPFWHFGRWLLTLCCHKKGCFTLFWKHLRINMIDTCTMFALSTQLKLSVIIRCILHSNNVSLLCHTPLPALQNNPLYPVSNTSLINCAVFCRAGLPLAPGALVIASVCPPSSGEQSLLLCADGQCRERRGAPGSDTVEPTGDAGHTGSRPFIAIIFWSLS